jgi:hypothetical protein
VLAAALVSLSLSAQAEEEANPLLRYRGGIDAEFRYELSATVSVEPQKQKLGSLISERYVFAENFSEIGGVLTLDVAPSRYADLSVRRSYQVDRRRSRGLFEAVRPEFEQRLLRDAPPTQLNRRLEPLLPEEVLLPWLEYPLYPLEDGASFQTELAFLAFTWPVKCSTSKDGGLWRLECQSEAQAAELNATYWISGETGWAKRLEVELRRPRQGYDELIQLTMHAPG